MEASPSALGKALQRRVSAGGKQVLIYPNSSRRHVLNKGTTLECCIWLKHVAMKVTWRGCCTVF